MSFGPVSAAPLSSRLTEIEALRSTATPQQLIRRRRSTSARKLAQARGVVSYWPLNDGGERARDVLQHNALSVAGTPTPNDARWVINERGRAFAFDGASYLASNADLSQWMGGSASLAFWIKTTQTGSSTASLAPGVTGAFTSSPLGRINWGWIDGPGRIRIAAMGSGGLSSDGAINDGVWRHVVLTRDADTGDATIYINGALNKSGSSGSAGTVSSAFFSIGRIDNSGGSPSYFVGELSDVMVFDHVVSAEEVLRLYKSPYAPVQRWLPVVIEGGLSIEAGGIATAESIGLPTIVRGPMTVSPSALFSGEAFGAPTLSSAGFILPSGIVSDEAFGVVTVTQGAITITPSAIFSTENVAVPSIITAGVIQPDSVASGEAIGALSLSPGAVAITPSAVVSAEAVGSSALAVGSVVVLPAGIASVSMVGDAVVISGATMITPDSVSSAEQFGAIMLVGGISIIGYLEAMIASRPVLRATPVIRATLAGQVRING